MYFQCCTMYFQFSVVVFILAKSEKVVNLIGSASGILSIIYRIGRSDGTSSAFHLFFFRGPLDDMPPRFDYYNVFFFEIWLETAKELLQNSF